MLPLSCSCSLARDDVSYRTSGAQKRLWWRNGVSTLHQKFWWLDTSTDRCCTVAHTFSVPHHACTSRPHIHVYSHPPPSRIERGGEGSRANTYRRQRSTKWSHPLSLAGRSASTRAWKAAYVCCPCLMRSDTMSTRRRARRCRAHNSAGLVGTRSDIILTKTGRATDNTGQR